MATISSSDNVPIVGLETTYVPRAFALLGIAEDNRPRTACASCPSAIWYQQPEWRCFCNIMKFQPWTGEGTPIQVCDGREASVAKYNTEVAGLGAL